MNSNQSNKINTPLSNSPKNGITLKPSKEKALLNKHHWIFSGAIAKSPKYEEGATLPVFSADETLIGYGYFNTKSSISGRMLSFGALNPEQAVKNHLDAAIALRQYLFPNPKITNAYRLVNAEGDQLPGLIIDRYDDVLVIQISTLGMERWKNFIVDYLCKTLKPRAIYENSSSPARKEEGLSKVEGFLYQANFTDSPDSPVSSDSSNFSEVTIKENGLSFIVSLTEGQKTGFFLDHREMRDSIRKLAQGKRVLNCFGYTGAFTLYACLGGAKETTTVDISKSALDFARRNLQLNNFISSSNSLNLSNSLNSQNPPNQTNKLIEADAFKFLREEPLNYDLVILDPPAFAKRKHEVVQACRGYKEINRQAIQKMPPKSVLLTCSCSYHVNPTIFQTVVFQAAVEAGRDVQIIGRHQLAPDHPINICHPEGDYLKSLLLWIN